MPDGEVWVHCAAGYRASIAASLLQAAGRRVVHVDDGAPEDRPTVANVPEPASGRPVRARTVDTPIRAGAIGSAAHEAGVRRRPDPRARE